MNNTASSIPLSDTTFANPHGLSNSLNVSTAMSLAILVGRALQEELFSTVVKTITYKCTLKNSTNRSIVWHNTNKLVLYSMNNYDLKSYSERNVKELRQVIRQMQVQV